ncbi:MAG: hypothetical protein HQ492_08830 [Woeseiaceae bacterium]|nr:hypothetical protein [Woeseiaceae bacterium]
MKYILALFLGLITGAVMFAVVLVYNPLVGNPSLSALAVSDSQIFVLGYPAVASETIVTTNDGESSTPPHPEKVLQLWEAPIKQTSVMATLLWDGRNRAAGIGIKLASASEKTRLFGGQAIVDSIWYVYLPGRGSLFIEQTENYWGYLRDIVFPAYRSSSNTWRGTWLGNTTVGPTALGTARVSGESGDFRGMEMLGVESLSIRTWHTDHGVVAGEGQLVIELPFETSIEPETDQEAQL